MKTEYITIIIAAIGLIVNLAALVALWSNLAAIWYNFKKFRKGGQRVTFPSNEYQIFSGELDKQKLLYQSTPNKEAYVRKREMGKIEHYEDIPRFFKWNMSHWSDDIRVPQYPLNLLS